MAHFIWLMSNRLYLKDLCYEFLKVRYHFNYIYTNKINSSQELT